MVGSWVSVGEEGGEEGRRMSVLSLMVFTGRWSVTGFYGVDERVILRAVGWGRMGRTLITFNSFSGPFCPRMESLWRSWTIGEKDTRP